MLSGDANENSDKNSRSNQQQKTTLHVQHTFLVHFLGVVFHDFNKKLPETSQLRVLCVPVHFCFRCRSFSLWWPLTFPLFLTAAIYKIVVFLTTKLVSSFSTFRSRSFSVTTATATATTTTSTTTTYSLTISIMR